jgi:hypothetical protein
MAGRVREVQRLSEPADRPRLPLLEDEDLTGEAVIEPSRLIRAVDAPAVAVACFFRDVVEELSGRADARAVCCLHSEMGPARLGQRSPGRYLHTEHAVLKVPYVTVDLTAPV